MRSLSEEIEITANITYTVKFEAEGKSFQNSDRIDNPDLALKISKDLQGRGFSPYIERSMQYNLGVLGPSRIENDKISIAALEEIVANKIVVKKKFFPIGLY